MTEFVTIPAAVFGKLCAAWEFQQSCNQPGSNALETGASRGAREWLHETVERVIENTHPCTPHHEQRELLEKDVSEDKVWAEFQVFWNAPEQEELRMYCAKGWAFEVWKASRAAIEAEGVRVKQ